MCPGGRKTTLGAPLPPPIHTHIIHSHRADGKPSDGWDNFVRMYKSLSDDDPPSRSIGKGKYATWWTWIVPSGFGLGRASLRWPTLKPWLTAVAEVSGYHPYRFAGRVEVAWKGGLCLFPRVSDYFTHQHVYNGTASRKSR